MNDSNDKLEHAEGFREAELESNIDVQEIHEAIIRERDDPRDGYEPISIWLIVLAMVIMFGGGLYLASHSGGFSSEVFDPSHVSWTGGGAAADKGPPDPMVLGKRVFTQNCLVCHQATGQGVAGQFPPLADSEWVLANAAWHGDNHIVKIVLNGLHGPITVEGKAFNNAMTPWKDVLNDQQIASVLTYIRNEWGNEAPAITEAFVADVRARNGDRAEPWTEEELKSVEKVSVADLPAGGGDAASGGGAAADVISPETLALGKRLFTQNCLVCHQATGQGLPGAFPPLAGSDWLLPRNGTWHGDNHIVKIVLNGMHGPIVVEGQPFNSMMTPWKDLLDDKQIAAILTYVRNEWGNKAPAITPEFVAEVRARNGDRSDPWTEAELKQVEGILVSGEKVEAAPASEPPAAAPQTSP
ncbi:MAG: c-type cytochrome [Chthoniobacterales bacterium]